MQPKLLTILLSTLFSIILWVFVSFSNNYTTTFKVPIEFTDIKEGNAILLQSTSEISITVKGQGWALAQLPKSKFRISTKYGVGMQNISTREAVRDNPWLSSNVQVVMLSPNEVNCAIEPISSKTVPIVADVLIKPQDGYGVVSNIKLSPDSVEVSGPKSLIRNIKTISTEKYSFENVDSRISKKIMLQSKKYLKYDKNYTYIRFDVQKIADKTFENIPVKVVNVPNLRELNLFPATINVTLRGGLENLGVEEGKSITATVDFIDAFKDTLGFIRPKITFPEFTDLVKVNPDKLNYIIKQY